MELLESLLVNKRNFKILATIYIVVVIIVLVWIWWPEKSLNIAKYEPYDETVRDKEMVEYYVRFIESIKLYGDEEVFEDYIDKGYLDYANITLEDVISMLKATDKSYVLNSFDVYKNGNSNIYSFDIPSGNDKLRVNIIEKGYPYSFNITYGNFISYSNLTYYSSIRGAKLSVTATYQCLNYIEYELSVTNEHYDELTLDFLDSDNFKLNLENGNTVYLNLARSTQGALSVEKGQTRTAKLVFNIGIAEQSNINSLSISKIFDGSSKLTTIVSF